MKNKHQHNVKVNEIWSIYNGEQYFVYTEDGESASLLEINYQLPPVAFYRKGEKCIGWQYKCNKELAKKFAMINGLEILDHTSQKLTNKEKILVK